MALVDLIMPKLGESIMEATILQWNKKVGDHVQIDEAVLEIATDKVDSEVPSTAAGVLEEVLFNVNDVVPIGAIIARIRSNSVADTGNGSPVGIKQDEPVAAPEPAGTSQQEEAVPYQPSNTMVNNMQGARFYSPLVLNIAGSEGVSLAELETIPGTGNGGRVTKRDLLAWVDLKKQGLVTNTAQPASVQQQITQETPAVSQTPVEATEGDAVKANSIGNVEIVEMDRTRKLIAKHMADSIKTSAHVTSFTECDVTNLHLWREKNKLAFEKREGEKLTFTPLFVEAIVKAIKAHPWLNSSVDGDKILIKKDINIGMATALSNGNLIVPVIREADLLNLTGLAKKVNKLASGARNNQLKPEDIQDGTFTITNVGTFGSLMGTPIINQPQVAILAIGAIKKRPVVVETEQGDSIAIRHMMYLSLSYDHRIIDGALGTTFLATLVKDLENFDINRTV